jgi:hypothetical protein
MRDHPDLSPGDMGISTVDMPTLGCVRLVHALLDDEGLPARLRLPAWLRRPLLDHVHQLLCLSTRKGAGEPPADGTTALRDPDAELLALGAEMELLGEVLRTWPDDTAAEHADARLAAVELEIAAQVPRTGAGLAVKLRLACELWVGGDLIVPDGGGPLPDGHDRARLLWALVDEAEALAAVPPRDAGLG